ncbi:hypothetical protein MMC34_003973 [Xylographa carneopallida]|nr:hypothetical protein [Xylographa carneopallida]
MASPNGEERLLTLYADAHYYFGEPTPRPLHHRFDKGSYVYLYRNAVEKRGRLEVANNAGKPEQDAFTGYLDSAKISQSYKHPTLCTIVVDGFHSRLGSKSSPISQDNHHWRLPSTDPRDEGKFLFRLHTIDLYFWTVQDSQTFLAAVRRSLQEEQLDIESPVVLEPHVGAMSPVVQQLENVAITDPAYHNGQTRNSRTTSIPTSSPARVPPTHEDPRKQEAADFTPLAYNPAAPPAPEVIKHREKTPPPPEAVTGTGLAAAAYHDQVQASRPQNSTAFSAVPPAHLQSPPPNMQSPQAYSGPPQSHASSAYGPSSPSGPHITSPSASAQGNRASSISSLPPPPPKSTGTTHNPYFPPTNITSFAPPPSSSNSVASPQSQNRNPAFAPPPPNPNAHLMGPGITPMESPATQILGNSYVAGPPQPLQHLHPQYADYLSSRPQQPQPVGGYSNYKYNNQQSYHHGGDEDYSIHNQVYRPTEEESHGHGRHRPSDAGPGQQPGRLEARAEKAEKGINSFLRKLEKKIG